jgi:peptidoglycan/xylan/chitin deacetylase (PgdA/CDA1 family)
MRARSAVIAAVVAQCVPAVAPVAPFVARTLRIPLRIPTDGVALTFDDGPHPEGTPAVLQALERAKVTATFFLAGEQIERYPSLVADIVAGGHRLGLHCHRHRNQLRLAPWHVREDMRRGHAAIADAAGVEPEVHRPPYGIYSAAGLALARARYRLLLWSRWGRDWRADATASSIAAKATEDLGAGDVILLHDADHYSDSGSWRHTVAALPLILEEIASRALPIVAA